MWDEVERIVEAVHARRPGEGLAWMTSSLESLVELLVVLLERVPSPVLALGVGLLAWRRLGVAGGVVAALVMGLLAWSRLWPLTVHTFAFGLIGALLAVPALAVVASLVRFGRRWWKPRKLLAPELGTPVALCVVVALAALAKPFAGSSSQLSWVVTIGLTAGVLSAPYYVVDRPDRLTRAVRAVVATSLGVALVLGLVGGFGLGGAVARAIVGGEIAGAADAATSVLLVSSLLVILGAEQRNRWLAAGRGTSSSNDPVPTGDEAAP